MLAVLFMDQLSKIGIIWILGSARQGVIPLLLFDLRMVHNRGAAFGMLQGHQEIFIGVALVTLGAAVLYLYRMKPDRQMQLIMGMIAGGALGNLVDRALYGYVIDFVDLGWWPVFNLADSAIVIGACLLAIKIMLQKDEIEAGQE